MSRRLRRNIKRFAPLLAAGGLAALLGVGLCWTRADPPPPAATSGAASPPTPAVSPASAVVSGPGIINLDQAAPTSTSAPEVEAVCSGCDIVLITVCSLRRDHVSAYGVMPGLTPSFDQIARDGWRFDRVYAASNFTLASLTAILTGRFGSTTGVTGWDKGLVADVPTLPEVLGYYGYRTGGFTIDAPSGFRPDYGLHRGFQKMEIIPPPRDNPDGRRAGTDPGLRGGLAAQPAANWIRSVERDQPLFAMFHTRTAHYPFVITDIGADDDPSGVTRALFDVGKDVQFTGPMPGSAGGTAQKGVVQLAGGDPTAQAVRAAGPAGVEVWRQRYAEAVSRTDDDIRVILEALEETGRLERTIVVVIADHGESLDDHNELLHGDAYFEGVVRIPLLIKVPGLPGGQVSDALVSQVDLAPTLLALVGATPPADIDGRPFVPVLTGAAEQIRGTTLVEGGVVRQEGPVPRGAVIAPPWTLLRQDRGCGGGPEPPRGPGEPASCLFDVDADPEQLKNQAQANPEVVAELLQRWDDFRAARGGEGRQLTLDPSYVEELHRTGYNFNPEPP